MEEMSHIPVTEIGQKSNKTNWATPIAIVIAGILVAGAVIYKDNQPVAPGPSDRPVADLTVMEPIDPTTDHIRGSLTAPITIIEYSDLECPFCKVFHQTMLDIYAKYSKTNQIAWVYRHFPLDMHPKARNEAVAAECANKLGGNDAFWKYIDRLFVVTPSNNGLDLALLPKIAKEIGLNEVNFNACLKDTKMTAQLDRDYQNGLKIGVPGTPFVAMINNTNSEKIVLFEDQIPTAWSADSKDIKADILKVWSDNLDKLRGN